MKKKVLFVMESLSIGGAEKSLITLLSNLDYSKYDVDLFLFYQKGEFLELLPKEVNLIEVPDTFKIFIKNPKESVNELIKKKKFKLLMFKGLETISLVINKFILKKEYIGWNYIAKSINTIPKNYDVAIGFLEKKSIYFTVDKINAKKKIGWIHTDYKKIEFNFKLDNKYLNKLDKIVAVSESCKKSLINTFQNIKDRICVIPNMISDKLIKKMANEKITDFNFIQDKVVICTVGRLTKAKGYDMAIQCCEKLLKRSLNFKWIVIGEGYERENIEKIINEKNLKENFILLGSKSNPYPYIKSCDIYVQPSIWEGFGITVSEAKILNKPIVVSDIPEFIEQIENNKTGVIYSDIEDMVNKIEQLILKKYIRAELISNLKNLYVDNNEEIKKIEELV
ncbi:TPA: glycosyltransferase [Clostridium perfringens]|uniref:glycosyltransferase n=1 Tax=Clostridium perfringens TaxID=1502 RepID=UPI001A25D403|nr:glycosyltransferase [Clostridium perfringens]UBK74353.1 glycosyltransferase [Clostridium perfringens]HAT4143108.1 glycosyltransferase [Clostridium perfringens]HAT4146240.1 glycosyltransferase [Clostridium perfringens]